MARFQFGKGKKKSFWDVDQFGRMLRTQETGGISDMLPGYRTFADDPAAREELERLAGERLGKGFTPVDDAARAIADAVAKPASPAPVPPKLPLRRDLGIYNEATGFMVTSMSMAGKSLEEGSRKWDKAVADGKMIPVTLFQDDPFVVRVVAGEPLTAQESEEWVARIEWWLDIPDGKLAITGGAVLVNEEYDADDPYFESYLGIAEVPPGRYLTTIYSYVPGVNGCAVLDYLAGGYNKSEPLGKWFRRTRPEETLPAWLRDWCVCDPSADPGHEEEWKSAKRPNDSEIPELVHFLVHLNPDPGKAGKPPIENGWFGEAEGARLPVRCPLGIEARDVVHSTEERETGGWIYVQDIATKVKPFECAKIEGGPVELAPGEIGNLCRLAWFSHQHSIPEIRAMLPRGASVNLPADAPPNTLVLLHDGVLRVSFSMDVKPAAMIQQLTEMAAHFAALPDGTEFEIAGSQLDASALEVDVPIGLHRYRGRIREGSWQVEEAFPKVAGTTLKAALALSAEVADGGAIAVNDAGEGEAILKWAKGNHGLWIEDNPGQIEGGRLKLGKPEPGVLALYGSATFAVRFGGVWPVLNLAEDDDGDEEVDMSIPIKGMKVLEMPSGRMYFATMALMVSETLAETIMKEERKLKAIGFTHVGDIVCNLFSKIAVRGYAKNGGDTWASFLVAAPETLVFEMSTRFATNKASLLTTRKPGAQDDAKSHTYRQSVSDGDYAAMWQQHEARKTELAAIHGAPVPVERSVHALAEAVEAALEKQLG